MRYLWEYGDDPRDFVRAMKYRPSRKLAELGGAWLAQSIPGLFGKSADWDLIAPIPMSPFNRKRRPFNQAEVMAQQIKTGLLRRIPVIPALRHRRTLPQAWLRHDDRVKRLRVMFAVRAKLISGRRILLVEDVITTGATTSAAVACLLDSGAKSVDVIALSRTAVWSRFRLLIHRKLGYSGAEHST